jgi:polyisoprenoid-binding protein YceI
MESIESNHSNLDKIVKSNEILDVIKYPTATFYSEKIIFTDQRGKCIINGRLTLHGVTNPLTFTFNYDRPKCAESQSTITAWGEWIIQRKEFDIVWNRIIDVGGIILSNYITINWNLVGKLKEQDQTPF